MTGSTCCVLTTCQTQRGAPWRSGHLTPSQWGAMPPLCRKGREGQAGTGLVQGHRDGSGWAAVPAQAAGSGGSEGASPGQGRTLGAAVWMGCRGSCCRCVAVTVSSALRFAVSHHPGLCPLSLLHDLFFLLHSQACLPPGPDAPRAHEGISRQTWAPGPPWKRWPSGPGRPCGGAGTAWARGSGRALWTSRPQR